MAENAVYCELFSGLGNQMFMYSAGYIISYIHKARYFVKKCKGNEHNHKEHNYAKLLFLDASECSTIPLELNQFNQEPSPFFPWDPSKAQTPCRIEGYFQYFPSIEPVIPYLVERFSLALTVHERNQSAFLHIRRGDYVEKSNIHYLQSPEYYVTAYIDLIHKLGTIPSSFLIFSDDIEWCKKQSWIQQIPNVRFYENDDEIETLAEMARCGGGAIIANSTFSWWGAILSKSQHVYYPSKWASFANFIDLFPKHWIKV
jgi:hypothetical protein